MENQHRPASQDASDTFVLRLPERSVAVSAWGFGMRSFVFSVQGAMPLLLYLAFLTGLEENLYSWFTAAWLGALTLLAIGLAFAYGVKASIAGRLLFTGILACSTLLAIYAWYSLTSGLAVAIGLLLYTIAALFRVRRWQKGAITASEGRTAFIFDTIAIVLVGIYSVLISALDNFAPAMVSFTALFGCFIALSRLYLLWFMERQISGSPPSTKTVWLPFLIVALLTAVFGPSLLFHSITGLAGLIGILLFPIVFIIQLLHLHLHLPTGYIGGNHQLVSNTIRPQWQKASTPPGWTHLIPITVLTLLFPMLLYLLFHKSKNKADQGELSEPTVRELKRKAIRSEGGLSFLSTTDPVRLRIQQWLRIKERAGIQIKSTDSVRHFHQQTGPLPEETLLEQYEDHRYNRNNEHSTYSDSSIDRGNGGQSF